MNKKTVRDVEVAGKRVVVRVDYNVAINASGQIADDTRLRASLDTIRYLLDRHARVVLISHLGRPDGKRDEKYSLAPVAKRLGELLGRPVAFLHDCVGDDVVAFTHHKLKDGEAVLLENLRFHPEEEANDPGFAKKLADLGEVYVNDAFGTAHRAHASTEGIAHFRPAFAGLLMEKELDHLSSVLSSPVRPFTAVLGGSKVSTKVGVIENLLNNVKVDHLLIGGGMTYSFLKAQGREIGDSLVDPKSLETARDLLKHGPPAALVLPEDVIVTDRDFDIGRPIDPGAQYRAVMADKIPPGWRGVDIGPRTIARYSELIRGSKTVVWNGPVGVFEIHEFAEGTNQIAKAIAESGATSVVGGGESVAAVHKAGYANKITWISTGGGASLEFLEGIPLPGVVVLVDKTSAEDNVITPPKV